MIVIFWTSFEMRGLSRLIFGRCFWILRANGRDFLEKFKDIPNIFDLSLYLRSALSIEQLSLPHEDWVEQIGVGGLGAMNAGW